MKENNSVHLQTATPHHKKLTTKCQVPRLCW